MKILGHTSTWCPDINGYLQFFLLSCLEWEGGASAKRLHKWVERRVSQVTTTPSVSYQDCKTHTWILNGTNAVAVFIVRLHLGLKGLALPEQRNRLFTWRCEHCRHFANNKRRIVNLRWHVCPPVCATHNRTRRTAITAGHSQTWLSSLSTSSSSSSVSSTLPSFVCLINKNWAFLFDDAWSSRYKWS